MLRTPVQRFADLPGSRDAPHLVDVADGLRMAYGVDGAAEGEPVLRHGEPTWSLPYRKVMPAERPSRVGG